MMLDVERLDETCIKKLANEEVLAIRVKGFLPEAAGNPDWRQDSRSRL